MSFKHLRINPRQPGATSGIGLERVSLPSGYENAEFAGLYERGWSFAVLGDDGPVELSRTAAGYRGAIHPRTGKPTPIRLKATGSPGCKLTRKRLKRAARRRLTRTIAA